MADITTHTNEKNKLNFRKNPTASAVKTLFEEFKTIQAKPSVKMTSVSMHEIVEISPGNGLERIQVVRTELAKLVEQGCLTKSVIDLLITDSGFLPIEGYLVDYKRDIPNDKPSLCKLLRHIVAFHNTYGGYLLLGAEETQKDKEIIPISPKLDSFDSKQIRDLSRVYLRKPIEIQSAKFTITFQNEQYELLLIHIPKRTAHEPAVFIRNGPEIEKNKPLFSRDQVYFRDGDNSIPATEHSHWQLIYSIRLNPYLQFDPSDKYSAAVYSNLPDRGLICPDFIGRENIMNKLYEWFTDDFSCTRVLAGEGGLGKTSIAYEFASEVARLGLSGVESVAWMSAKKLQFRALDNEYETRSVTHFSNSREMFIELANQIAGQETAASLVELPDLEVPRFLRELITDIRIFAVIDDLDSLDIDEQKRCIEVCQQLSGQGSRFLFTTRKNATASSSTAIELQGLDEIEYSELIQSWCKRLNLPEFTLKEIARLRDATLGSPLYTESLLRLIRNGLKTYDAIAKWKGNLGIEVRKAALQREVVQLTAESRKVLVTVAIFGECSFAEVKQSTDYAETTIIDCFNELQSLFLVRAPSIATLARFGISATTRELVLSLGSELLPGFIAYKKNAEENKFKVKGFKSDLNSVGAAINQANALLASTDSEQIRLALQTVDEVNNKLGGKNADLLSMRGRVLSRMGPDKLQDASKAFRQAFDAGQRKLVFFKLWHDAEIAANRLQAVIDVCTHAIDASAGAKFEWLLKRAHARTVYAASFDRSSNLELIRSQFNSAAEDLNHCKNTNPDMAYDMQWKEYLFTIHDFIWAIDSQAKKDLPSWIITLDNLFSAIERGDVRIDVYEKCVISLTNMHNIIASRSNDISHKELNLLEQKVRECLTVFKKAPNNLKTMRLYSKLQESIESVAVSLSNTK